MSNVLVEMKYYTCGSCGFTYGYPKLFRADFCPLCTRQDRDQIQELRSEEFDQTLTLERRITGLRGALKKARKS